MGRGASVVLRSRGILDAQNDRLITNSLGGAAIINNGGTLKKSAGSGITDIQVALTNTITGTLQVETGTLSLTGEFTNFLGSTLGGGKYVVGSCFRFVGADIVHNAANIILSGTSAQIVDLNGNDALANFADNQTGNRLTIQNGANLITGNAVMNAGTLTVGNGRSHFTTSTGFTNVGTVRIGDGSLLTAGADYIQLDGSTILDHGVLSGGSNNGPATVNINGGVLSGSGATRRSVSSP